jgi:hypothetical protein
MAPATGCYGLFTLTLSLCDRQVTIDTVQYSECKLLEQRALLRPLLNAQKPHESIGALRPETIDRVIADLIRNPLTSLLEML